MRHPLAWVGLSFGKEGQDDICDVFPIYADRIRDNHLPKKDRPAFFRKGNQGCDADRTHGNGAMWEKYAG